MEQLEIERTESKQREQDLAAQYQSATERLHGEAVSFRTTYDRASEHAGTAIAAAQTAAVAHVEKVKAEALQQQSAWAQLVEVKVEEDREALILEMQQQNQRDRDHMNQHVQERQTEIDSMKNSLDQLTLDTISSLSAKDREIEHHRHKVQSIEQPFQELREAHSILVMSTNTMKEQASAKYDEDMRSAENTLTRTRNEHKINMTTLTTRYDDLTVTVTASRRREHDLEARFSNLQNEAAAAMTKSDSEKRNLQAQLDQANRDKGLAEKGLKEEMAKNKKFQEQQQSPPSTKTTHHHIGETLMMIAKNALKLL